MNKHTEEPLLYIEQPALEKPSAFMQENYSSLIHHKDEEADEMEENDVQVTNPFLSVLEDKKEEVEVYVNEVKKESNDKKEELTENDSLAFNELSLQGKIDYFINLPKEMPKIKSEIVLDKDVYRGYILEDDGEAILIETGRFEEAIQKENIKDIILIGF